MNIVDKLKTDIQKAVKSGDKKLADTLKYLYSLLQTEQARGEKFDPVKILQKEMKTKKEALKMFEEAGRKDLAEKEKKDISVLEEYLPKMMSDQEITEVIVSVLDDLGKPEFGQVMGKVMKEVKGRADGSKVSKIVKEKLTAESD